MKKFEFQTYVNDDKTVTIPADVVAQIEGDGPVRVIMLVPDDAEQQEWSKLTATQFLKGYAEADAIYDIQQGIHELEAGRFHPLEDVDVEIRTLFGFSPKQR